MYRRQNYFDKKNVQKRGPGFPSGTCLSTDDEGTQIEKMIVEVNVRNELGCIRILSY